MPLNTRAPSALTTTTIGRTPARRRAIALAGALLLAGCSSSSPEGGVTTGGTGPDDLPACPVEAVKSAPGKVEVLMWYQLDAKTGETLVKQVDRYNQAQNKVHVRAEKQGADYDELLAAYQRALDAKTLPDIAVMEQTSLQYLIDTKTVLPGQACFQADKIGTEQFNRNAVAHYTVGGVLYPASVSISDVLTYFNRNHYRRAGLDPDKPPATLEEVRAHAEAIKAAGITERPVILKMASWFLELQLTGDHQDMVDNDNGHGSGKTTRATFDNESTRRLFQWIREMIDAELLTAVPDTPGQFDHYIALANQRSTISVETSTAATSIKAFLSGDTSVGDAVGTNTGGRSLDSLDVGGAPVFGITGAGRAMVGGNGFFITKPADPSAQNDDEKKRTAEKQSASWDFLKWWNQPEQQYVWHVEGSYLPFLNSVKDDPRVASFWKDDVAGRLLKVGYDEMVNGIDPQHTGPIIGPYKDFRVTLRNALDAVAFNKGNPDEAVTKAVADATAAIKRYNEGNF